MWRLNNVCTLCDGGKCLSMSCKKSLGKENIYVFGVNNGHSKHSLRGNDVVNDDQPETRASCNIYKHAEICCNNIAAGRYESN